MGGISETTVDLRLLFKNAVRLGTTALIVAPLTPGGSLRPSQSAAPSKLLQDFART